MSEILARLHQDHIHMAEVLNVLDRQLEVLRHPEGEQQPDLNLILECAHYFVSFPDKVHHVAEDKLFAKTEEVLPDMKSEFDRLRKDHQTLAREGEKFHHSIEKICAGEVQQRTVIINEIDNFVRLQRAHMDLEEGKIFPRAKAGLSAINFDEIEADYLATLDPIFSDKIEDYYERIREAIIDVEVQ